MIQGDGGVVSFLVCPKMTQHPRPLMSLQHTIYRSFTTKTCGMLSCVEIS